LILLTMSILHLLTVVVLTVVVAATNPNDSSLKGSRASPSPVVLAKLAKMTKTETARIVEKIKDIVAEDRDFDGDMRSRLRSIMSLLKTSERKLDLAKKNINNLREKVNTILAFLEILKDLAEAVQEKEEFLLASTHAAEDIGNIIQGLANIIHTSFIKDTTQLLLKGTGNEASSADTAYIVWNAFAGIDRFGVSLVKVLQRPDVAGDLNTAVTNIGKAMTIINKQKDNMDAELTIIIQWRDAVETVKEDVFDADLVDNIKDVISEPRDLNEIYDAFGDLKYAASAYLRQVSESCPSCVD